MSNVGNSSNIVWHKCSVEKADREKLLHQRGCVIWVTGLSGSGISSYMFVQKKLGLLDYESDNVSFS